MAAPMPSECSRPDRHSWCRSGSPTRGSRWSSPTVGERRLAARPGSERWPAIWPSGAGRPNRRPRCPGRTAFPSRLGPSGRAGLVIRRLPGRVGSSGRPDRFHAAIAGAPVTDWRLYDTHYTERYLGHPDHNPEAYTRTSLLELAGDLARPLLLICGLADDNVFAATPSSYPKCCSKPAAPIRCSPCPCHPHDPSRAGSREPAPAATGVLFDSLGLQPPQ